MMEKVHFSLDGAYLSHAANDSNNTKKEFRLVRVSDLIKNPQPIQWTIKGIFEKGGMNVLFGSYGSGKSLVAFEMAYCVAAGIDWHEYKVAQGSVVIIAGEGHSGISQRFAALSIHYSLECPDNIHLSEAPANFTDPDNAKWVFDAVEKTCPDASLVIVDTLNRNFGMGDENSTSDMTKFVNNLDKQFRENSKTILIVHHTSKGDADNSRGSVVLPSACEGEFAIKKVGETGLSFSCKKQKNHKKSEQLEFSITEIELPEFSFDDDIATSAVLTVGYGSNSMSKNESKRLTQDEDSVMNALAWVYEKKAKSIPPEVMERYSIDKKHSVVFIPDWRIEAYKRLSVDCEKQDEKTINNAKKSKFARVRRSLYKKNRVVEHNGYAWYYDYSENPTPNKT